MEIRDTVYLLLWTHDTEIQERPIAGGFDRDALEASKLRHRADWPDTGSLVVRELAMPASIRTTLEKGAHFGMNHDLSEVGCWFGKAPFRCGAGDKAWNWNEEEAAFLWATADAHGHDVYGTRYDQSAGDYFASLDPRPR